MHRHISKVFKIIIGSILLMILLDTVTLVVEIISIHSRVSAVMSTVQTEVARNNHMPEAMAEAFTDYFEEIAMSSSLLDPVDVTTNFTARYTSRDGETYEALSADNAGEYGDIVTVVVHLELHPAWVYFNSLRTADNMSFLGRSMSAATIRLDYIYSVPCLRYLK